MKRTMVLQSTQPNDNDAALMDQLARADWKAFEKLYEKYLPIVRSFLIARRCDPSIISDIIQETFTFLWQQQGQYRGLSDVKTYILAIAKNVLAKEEGCIHRETFVQKKKAMELSRTLRQDLSIIDAESSTISEFNEILHKALSQLTNKQQQAVELVYILKIPIAEAAGRANCSEKVLYDRIYSAHHRLEQLLAHVPSIRKMWNRRSKIVSP